MSSRTVLMIFLFVLAGVGVFFVSSFRVHPSSLGKPLNKSSAIGMTDVQAFILPIAEPNYLPIRDFNRAEPDIEALATGIYDIKSGRLLYANHVDDQFPIASLTKLMTAVAIRENLNLDEAITVAPEDLNVDGLGADLIKGEQITGRNLLQIMLIKSSNDAAFTFASVAKTKGIDLVAKMNEKAIELGMDHTHYRDPAGLDDGGFSTVNDLIKLVMYMNRYPDIWAILRQTSKDVSSLDGRFNHHIVATNQLLGQIPYIIGGKTGYTDRALGAMALEVGLHDDKAGDLISIVLGSNDRFGMTKKLIDWVKVAYRWE